MKLGMNRPRKRAPVNPLFSLWLLFLAVPLGAAEPARQEVQLKIGTVLASNQSDDFDPRLAAIKSQLEVIKYRSYRLIKEESQTVPWQANAAFDIPGGRSLLVLPQEFRNQRLSLKVRLMEGEKPLLDTTVRLRNRGNFLLGGPAHEGGVLILSISATTR